MSRSDGSLDPEDWPAFRKLAHEALDRALDSIEHVREAPVWQEPTDAARKAFDAPLPREATPLPELLNNVQANIFPYSTGNRHPRFMGWVHGAGTPAGVVAEMLTASLNMNCGGRNHIGLEIERQIARWMASALGYPETATGLFLTGSSMANFVALIVAKTKALGPTTREKGIATPEGTTLTGYASREAHSCISRAFELSGLGASRLRLIETDAQGRMRPEALEAEIRKDLEQGLKPFFCVATAGSVNTGAFDPLSAIADIADQYGLWLHVDGAIGALAVFSRDLKTKLEGIEKSQSIAMDFHKSGQVPYDAGFLLVKDCYTHRLAFSSDPHYLTRSERGLASGGIWPVDLGPDLSRGLRALKTWFTLMAFGTDAIGRSIEHTVSLAKEFAARIEKSSEFELKAPVAHNIVCFGVTGPYQSQINQEIVIALQTAGIAAPSTTEIAGEVVIRAAFVNHRTTLKDLDITLDAAKAAAGRLMSS